MIETHWSWGGYQGATSSRRLDTLGAADRDWAEMLIAMTPDEIARHNGDLVDFSGSGNVLAAVIEEHRKAAAKLAGPQCAS